MDFSKIINRSEHLFNDDLIQHESSLREIIKKSHFLVLGAAGSIGQSVTKELFKRNPKRLHAVDISENNLVELVRDLRSSLGYISGDFQTFALDVGSSIFETFFRAQDNYDFILNLTALKHVRSEKDPYTLMRMVDTNIFNTLKTLTLGQERGIKKYFCVSTDKAAAPINMMGASKRIMEKSLFAKSSKIDISTARFANVAFSDGSLLHGFSQRLSKNQPIVAPKDIKRYFITPEESGLICLFSCLLGKNKDIFFPKLKAEKDLGSFQDIAIRFLEQKGYTPYSCKDEQEARDFFLDNPSPKTWPCLWSESDTSGEKSEEIFYMQNEKVDLKSFSNLGIVKMSTDLNIDIEGFYQKINNIRSSNSWCREDLIELFQEVLPEFQHHETGKFLDSKM